jgi:hypothetical protein
MTGPRGYVLCEACGQEDEEISRDTAKAWAYHPKHRPWNERTEREQAADAIFDALSEIKQRQLF